MAIEYKSNDSKAKLLEIAVANGIKATDKMAKAEITALFDEKNVEESAQDSTKDNEATETAEIPQKCNEVPTATNNATNTESMTENDTGGNQSNEKSEYTVFVYKGPSIPRGRLKENAVFRGTFDDVKEYLKDVLDEFPQAEKLFVPVHRLAEFTAKVKTPGNIANKYYNDIVSAIRKNKEV